MRHRGRAARPAAVEEIPDRAWFFPPCSPRTSPASTLTSARQPPCWCLWGAPVQAHPHSPPYPTSRPSPLPRHLHPLHSLASAQPISAPSLPLQRLPHAATASSVALKWAHRAPNESATCQGLCPLFRPISLSRCP